MKNKIKKILREEFVLNEQTIEEGVLTNWLAAGALILGTLGPNTSLAQKYNDGDDKTKIAILNKIKSEICQLM